MVKKVFKTIWHLIRVIGRNKYTATVVGFIIWIAFIDTYNLIDRYKNLQKLNGLKKEVEFFKKEIESLNTQYDQLFSNKNELEKFAREQFLMKEDNEDVFIVIHD